MEQLVITAGDKKYGKFLAEVWLPSLRKNAMYRGKVVIFDYDLSDIYRSILVWSGGWNVSIEKQRMKLDCNLAANGIPYIWGDRHRAIYNYLVKMGRADVTVLCVDGDMTFQAPIAPLFDLAEDTVCYTVEEDLNEVMLPIKGPDADNIWKVIKDKPVINGGLYIGPIADILKLEKFIAEHIKYFPIDQHWLNALIYYYNFPAKRVDDTWNWYRGKGFKIINGIYCTPDGEKVAIFHHHPSPIEFKKKEEKVSEEDETTRNYGLKSSWEISRERD